MRFQTPSVTRILGHDPAQLVGTAVTDLLRPPDARRLRSALAAAARSPGRPVTLDFPVWAKDGSWCDTETTVTSLVHDPDIRGLVLNTRDVSERRRLEEKLTQQAYSDELTGLANRSFFRSKVEMALKVALAAREVAVLFLDLDGFKSVNDTQGHHVGDELLCLVAKRLSSSVRPGDVVARLGGDEFAVLVTGPAAEEGAVWVADRVRRALSAPYVLDGRELTLGGVHRPGHQRHGRRDRRPAAAQRGPRDVPREGPPRQVVRALRGADARRPAGAGQGRVRPAAGGRPRGPGAALPAGRRAGERPDRRCRGARALGPRRAWPHRAGTLHRPGGGDRAGLRHRPVGAAGGCRQGARWQRYAAPGGSFKVAVNVSARQLEQRLPREVRDALGAAGLPGSALTLEMTESVLMERTDEVVELLRRIKTLGVRLAVDDFGTGYSSLSYLSRFPSTSSRWTSPSSPTSGRRTGRASSCAPSCGWASRCGWTRSPRASRRWSSASRWRRWAAPSDRGSCSPARCRRTEVDALLAAQAAAAEVPVPS